MPKDFYSIRDFYQSLQNPDRVPTAHRHFQVYLYPIYSYGEQIVTKSQNNFYYSDNAYNKGGLMEAATNYHQMYYSDGNGFFTDWFTEDTIEQFSLAIQSIKFPTSFGTPTQNYTSPFGDYFGVDNNKFYGKSINGNEVSFQLIDQISPFFEKKINEWIWTINRCTIPNQAGTLFPKVNMAIKYFKLTEVSPGWHYEKDPNTGREISVQNTAKPNFIYYFKEAFPVKFDTCTIDHSGQDSLNDLRRTLVFNFNIMYVLQNAQAAQRFGLDYLFGPVCLN